MPTLYRARIAVMFSSRLRLNVWRAPGTDRATCDSSESVHQHHRSRSTDYSPLTRPPPPAPGYAPSAAGINVLCCSAACGGAQMPSRARPPSSLSPARPWPATAEAHVDARPAERQLPGRDSDVVRLRVRIDQQQGDAVRQRLRPRLERQGVRWAGGIGGGGSGIGRLHAEALGAQRTQRHAHSPVDQAQRVVWPRGAAVQPYHGSCVVPPANADAVALGPLREAFGRRIVRERLRGVGCIARGNHEAAGAAHMAAPVDAQAAAVRSGERGLSVRPEGSEGPAPLPQRGVGRSGTVARGGEADGVAKGRLDDGRENEGAGMARPFLIDGDGFLVGDDVDDIRDDARICDIEAEDERRGHDGPRAKVRSIPAVVQRTVHEDAAHLQDVGVRPAAGAAERLARVLVRYGGLEVGKPRQGRRADVAARPVPVEGTPVERRARRVVGVGAVAPVAVLDGVSRAGSLHQRRVHVHVALRTATVVLDAVKAKLVQLTHVALVVPRRCDALAARAAILVPPHLEPSRVAVPHEPRQVRELGIYHRVAVGVVLRAVHASTAGLPSLVEPRRGVPHIGQRHVAHAVHRPHLGRDRVDRSLHAVLRDSAAERVPGAPPERRRGGQAVPARREARQVGRRARQEQGG
eukprot:5828842-Prymnesium_polylepis.2